MKPTTDDLAEDDPRVLEAARDYLADLEAGRKPDRRAYLARYPELAGALAECFDGIELAHGAAKVLRPPPSPEDTADPLGDFRIVREVGRGGMGVVYEAVQLSLGRRVALKVLPFAAALDAKQLQRFKTEAHAAAQLHHTNIVPVHAVGCERGVHFYAMQLIDGRALDAVIRELRGDDVAPASGPDDGVTVDYRAGPTSAGPSSPRPASAGTTTRSDRSRQSFRTAAQLAAQVADALEYAHDAGVVHRDVKPANLLLDAKGTVWVTDFGLAQVSADVGLTQTGDVVGTLRYMSPEQAAGRRARVDHRTDIYSLGATLYELLTLEPLFPGNDRQTLLRQILEEEPRPPRQADRSIPVELETIVLKALAKAPADRYATAGEMAADLRRFLEERPILARRPTLVDRARKWMRRHPSYVGAAVLVLVCGVVGLAACTALIARAQALTQSAYDREAQRAREAEERFRLARRSVDEMIQIAEGELADQPHMEGLRKRLLEAALAYYQEFIEQRRDDRDAQADLEVTRDRVKKIVDDLAVLQGAWQHLLLRDKAVLDDLRLSDEQRVRVADLTRRMDERGPEAFRDYHRLPPDERRRPFLEMVRTTETTLDAILRPEQRQRLRQIVRQLQGASAFREADVIAELKLTAEQRELLRGLESARTPIRLEMRAQGTPQPRAVLMPAPTRPTAGEAYLEILTDVQKKRWAELTGEPFRGPAPRVFPGRGMPPGERR